MKKLLYLFLVAYLFASCEDSIIEKNTPHNVFLSFWQIMSDKYVYFEEKKLNWDSIYQYYNPKITDQTPDTVLQKYFQEIVTCISDGHVNVYIPYKKLISYNDTTITYSNWTYNASERYGFSNHKFNIVADLAQLPNDMLYFHMRSFGYENEREVTQWIKNNMKDYHYQNGIVVDIRNNGGGREHLSVLGLFYQGTRDLYRIKYRTNKDRAKFTPLYTKSYKGSAFISSNIPIAMLTNKATYSMGNLFAFAMKTLPNCTSIGEQTGGGGGSITEYYLPNDWILSVTTSKAYSLTSEDLEKGLPPDIEVIVSKEFWANVFVETGEDPQLDAALQFLNAKRVSYQ